MKELKELLLHCWRLLVEPTHDGLLMMQPLRGQVIYKDGNKTIPMSYRTACDYAEIATMSDGPGATVVRWKK